MHLPNERLNQILSVLEKEKYITVQELSKTLDVSMVTIRKDLALLENQGYLYRTHGGASKKSRYAFEENVLRKESINVKEKQKIARKALEFIKENDFIILASGTTIHYLARIMNDFQKLTVLTSSLRVSVELCNIPSINTIQIGGEVRKSSTSVIGPLSESILNSFSCNKLFLGIDGIDIDFGISTSNVAEASLNQQMIKHADKVYVLGDSSKVNKRGFGKICDLSKVDVFITDSHIEKEEVQKLESIGINVVIAS